MVAENAENLDKERDFFPKTGQILRRADDGQQRNIAFEENAEELVS